MGAAHVPPSEEHSLPAAHCKPTVGLDLQHCVAATMHVDPQEIWPEGQAASGRGGKRHVVAIRLSKKHHWG